MPYDKKLDQQKMPRVWGKDEPDKPAPVVKVERTIDAFPDDMQDVPTKDMPDPILATGTRAKLIKEPPEVNATGYIWRAPVKVGELGTIAHYADENKLYAVKFDSGWVIYFTDEYLLVV